MRIFLLLMLLVCSVACAETIYNPLTKEAVYEYKGEITKDTVFKSSDFECLKEECFPIRMVSPFDISNGIALDGFDYFMWGRGYILPKKPYPLYTFLVKEGDDFVWKPYSEDEIKNILGL